MWFAMPMTVTLWGGDSGVSLLPLYLLPDEVGQRLVQLLDEAASTASLGKLRPLVHAQGSDQLLNLKT